MKESIISSLIAATIFWLIPYFYKIIFCYLIFYRRYKKQINWLNYCLKSSGKSIKGNIIINSELLNAIKNIDTTSKNKVKVNFKEFLNELYNTLNFVKNVQKKWELTYFFSKYFYHKEDNLKKLIIALTSPESIMIDQKLNSINFEI